MGFTSKIKSKSSSSEGWGMGFLLVFFPEEDQNNQQESKKKSSNFSLFSPSLRRTNSSQLLHKAQSTISICLLLLFTTVLLFTLSTLPSSPTAHRLYQVPRRQLSSRLQEFSSPASNLSRALQGMGTLYRRGTRAMSDLIVAHALESLSLHELKLFLRLFYRSSLASKSDLVFVFPSKSSAFDDAIVQENRSFLKLLAHYTEKFSNSSHSTPSFDATPFLKPSKKEKESGEPIWGRKIRANSSEEDAAESTRPSYGSVVGFDVEELDPENSLSGFLDHVPMSLRRWACYPMLLGRVKRNFKRVMLVDAKEILLLGDPLVRVRSLSPESVLTTQSTSSRHGKKSQDKTQSTRQKLVHPGIVMGGSKGIRRLSNEMLTDIVRASMQHKKKNPITESGLFNQLVGNDYALKNVNLTLSIESVPDLSSASGSSAKSGSHSFMGNHSWIRKGNSNLDVNSEVMKYICSFPIDSTVYSDC